MKPVSDHRRRCDQEMAAATRRASRRQHLRKLADDAGIELPAMPAGDVWAIHRAEQTLIDASIDPGPWDPGGSQGDPA